MSKKTDRFHGQCFCGAVAFSMKLPSKWCSHCHCTMCQRAHGAAFVTWVGFAADQVDVDETELRWHDSSNGAQRGFCKHCGSTLFFRSERWPGELHVVRSNIDGDIDRHPAVHAFYEGHVDWIELGDDLPRRDGSEYADP